MSHAVAHLDADAFFASVEQASDTRLRGRPVAVGGEKRGIIASASYEARQFGIYTPMPTVRARRLCPRLIVLPGDFEKYEQFSKWMFSYAYDFTPEVEISSIDEGYLGLAGVKRPAIEVAATLRDAIRQALKITVSEGIGSNKLISQIASKLNKPAAFRQVPDGDERLFLDPLPNRWLPGVGPKTAARLNAAGLPLIRQVATLSVDLLSLLVGSAGPQLSEYSRGIDKRPVVPASEPAKSYSQQETFDRDQTDEAFLEATLRHMADRLFVKVRADGKSVRTLTVRVRYNDMDEDQVSESLPEPTDLETDVYGRIGWMLKRAWRRRVSLRLVSLKLSNLYGAVFRAELALDRAAEQHDARRRLAGVVDQLRHEYGPEILLRGHDWVLREGEPDPTPEVRDPRPAARPRLSGNTIGKPMQRLGELKGGTGVPPAPASVTGQAVAGQRSVESQGGNRLIACPTSAPKRTVTAIPLVVRSHYSFLNSTLSVADVVSLAKQHELPAIALCDQGNLHGAVEFVLAARNAGIKPLVGAEIQVGGQPVWLYVQNQTGYANLCRILSEAPKSGTVEGGEARSRGRQSAHPDPNQRRLTSAATAHDRRPSLRISDFRFRISRDTTGLLAVSPDASLAALFPGRFYRALLTRRELRRYARDDGPPVVPILPVHYATAADRWKFDIVQSIRTLTLLRQPHPDKLAGGNWHFRAPTEWRDLFGRHPELIEHTGEIADRCDFSFRFGQPQFPPFHPPDGSESREFLRRLVFAGLRARYPTSEISNLKSQIQEELQIIHDVGYEDYFLITWDLLRACRQRGIDWITRGSAADSLVCYCLGISNVCPIRFELYFRRFLNKERMALNKLPDIDIDFPHDRKDDVVDLVFEKYGPEHCAVVGGFSTFRARSAFAEVAKVLGVSEREVRRFTENFPWSFGGSGEANPNPNPKSEIRSPKEGRSPKPEKDTGVSPPQSVADSGFESSESLRTSGFGLRDSGDSRLAALLRSRPETGDLPIDEEPYRSALVMAEFLDGVPRYPKMHPCGVVVSRDPMHALTPTFVSQKGWATTHFEMDAVEAIGLVKMDILAQGGLAAMRDAQVELAKRGLTVDLERFEVGERTDPKSEIRNPKEARKPGIEKEDGAAPARSDADLASDFEPSDFLRTSDFGLRNSLLVDANPSPSRFDDPEVWDLIASGNARAVHHIESPAMISLCRMTNVRDIDTLVAIVSVIRPGAANEDKKREFTRRYQGLSPITYPHPSLEPCLRSTFGLVVYEEHILQICEAFAGLPGGRADVLRRALVKENWPMIAQIEQEFIASARKRGHAEEDIVNVWQRVVGFHGYAFCKAHSAAYGVEAYQSAWLKRNFPAEFMAAVLTNGKGFYRPLVYVLEAWRLGVPLLPPWVNEPGPAFTVVNEIRNPKSEVRKKVWASQRSALHPGIMEGRAPRVPSSSSPIAPQIPLRISDFGFRISSPSSIRVPVTHIADLTERTKETLLAQRSLGEFASLADFYLRVWASREEMETLSRAAAFDGFGQTRCEQFWEIQQLVARWGHDATPGQGWLLPPKAATLKPETRNPKPEFREPTRSQRLQWETELLGFTASGHPLELYPDIAWDTYCPVSRLGEFVGEEVTLCGLVIEDRVHHQVTGEAMKFLTLCDWTGMVETELFAATYRTYGLVTVRYPVLEVTGRVEPYENGRGHSLRVLRAGEPRQRP